MFVKISEILILVGTVSLIYYDKITDEGVLSTSTIVYRYDFIFAIAIFFGIIKAILILLKHKIRLNTIEEKIFSVFMVFFLSSLFATFISYFIYDLSYNLQGFANLTKLFMNFALTILIYLLIQNNPNFSKHLSIALYLSPMITLLLTLLFLMAPSIFYSIFGSFEFITRKYSLLTELSWGRFEGLTSNPFQVAITNLVAISFLWVFALYYFNRNKIINFTLLLVYIGGLTYIIFLTGVRSAFIVLAYIFLAGLLFFYKQARNKKKLTFIVAILLIGTTLMGAYKVLPVMSRESMAFRFGDQDRLEIWKYFIGVSLENPFGVGFNFEQKYGYKTPYFDSDRPNRPDFPPHNNFLTASVYGGILSFLCLIFFFKIVILYIKKSLTAKDIKLFNYNDLCYIGAIIALGGIWIISIFIGLPFFEQHAIVLAMIIAYGDKYYRNAGKQHEIIL